jgi:hypothetical protein
VAIQGRKHRAAALDCFVAPLLAMTTMGCAMMPFDQITL